MDVGAGPTLNFDQEDDEDEVKYVPIFLDQSDQEDSEGEKEPSRNQYYCMDREDNNKDEDEDCQEVTSILRTVMQAPEIASLSPPPPPQPDHEGAIQKSHDPLATKKAKQERFVIKVQPLVTTLSYVVVPYEQPIVHATLPEGFRYLFADYEKRNITGVVACRQIEMGEKFGPYNGALLDKDAGHRIGSTWEVGVRT